jgi:stage II sporulation protein D
VIDRAAFLSGGLVVATGGLDVWDDEPASRTAIRVALAGGQIETLDIEKYLRGVVPLEAPSGWPAAALQAQAIVARTYALSRRNLTRAYDVLATDTDQRYGGEAVERPPTNAAVDSTRGLTVRFNSGPASVFYSSCCGGRTADAATLWGRSGLPYLRGVPDDPNCMQSPDYRWRRTVPIERGRTLLGDRLRGTIMSFDLTDTDVTGRARTVIVRDDGGGTVPLTVDDFRRRFGTDVVRSLWLRHITLDVTQAAPVIVIEGSGRGHGVGLCQWGARGMAAAGADAATILRHFFPGTEVAGG